MDNIGKATKLILLCEQIDSDPNRTPALSANKVATITDDLKSLLDLLNEQCGER